MKKRNKVTPEIYKEILQIAHGLPMFYRTDKSGKTVYTTKTEVKKWEDLTEDELKQALKNPNIKPGKKISISRKEPVLINHVVMLTEYYQAGGRETMDKYIDHCHKLKQSADANSKKDNKA